MTEFEKPLPSSPEAERTVLGLVLLNNALFVRLATELLPEQFYVPAHRRIFLAMTALAERGEEINPILIGEELTRDGGVESVGGPAFVGNLTYGLPHSEDIKGYAKVIRDKAALRQLIRLASKITNQALEEEDDAEKIVGDAETALFELGMQTRLASKSTVRTYDDVAGSVMDMFERWSEGHVVSIPSRIPEVDRKLAHGGFSGGDLIVIAARTSFGKSALALQIALNATRAKTPVLFFSLEMSAEKLFIRNLSSVTGVPHNQIKPWTFANDLQTSRRIAAGVPKLTDLPMYVEDRTYSLNRLCSIARDWRRRTKIPGLIVTDYIQLVNNKLDKRSREQEVAGISTELKRLAKELDVPVIGISQFSRDQTKQNRRPELHDLRESGQIENDCDVVLFPWSTDTLEDKPVRGMRLYCPKQRSGKVGWELDIDFDGEHQWFSTPEMYQDGGQA